MQHQSKKIDPKKLNNTIKTNNPKELFLNSIK